MDTGVEYPNGDMVRVGDRVSYAHGTERMLKGVIRRDSDRPDSNTKFEVHTTHATKYAIRVWAAAVGRNYPFSTRDRVIFWNKMESLDWWDVWGVQ